MNRRQFIKKSGYTATGIVTVAPAFIRNIISDSPNERLNVAVIGISGQRKSVRGMINGRGIGHIREYSRMPNVRIATLCDVDERLFPEMVAEVERLNGNRPKTEWDFRKVLDDKDIDAVSIVTPDHWHALQTIWACQAGKDVYVEKPLHHNISEGRKMIAAARKYKRVVQMQLHHRVNKAVIEGVKFVREGKLGNVYMSRGIVARNRPSIGHVNDGPIPDGVHWDMFLGPAPYRPFNENRYIYTWHWFWDTGTTEIGNNGIYRLDKARWAMNINTHPVEVHCTGGKYCRDDDDQEVPNVMTAVYKYADGRIIQNEIRSLYSNSEGLKDDIGDCFIYGDQGWMILGNNGFKTFFGNNNEPGPSMIDKNEERYTTMTNFIECVKGSRKIEDLEADVAEGHLSTVLVHLANVSYRTGRKLKFDPNSETFLNDEEANFYLTRDYRYPYVIPKEI